MHVKRRFWSIDSCLQGRDTPGFYLTNASIHTSSSGYHARQPVIGEFSNTGRPRTENDAKDTSVEVAEIQISKSTRLIGLIENIFRFIKRLETSGAKKNISVISRLLTAVRVSVKQAVLNDVNAKPFIPRVSQYYHENRQSVFPASQTVPHPTAPPPNIQESNAT